MSGHLTRLAPIGEPLDLASAWRALREVRAPADALRTGLRERLGAERLHFYCSGREALRVVFQSLGEALGRDEVVIPAYTCYSVPAAVVAAGMRVRLVDVTPHGALDPQALAAAPLERAAAVVVCNLLGIPEPVEQVRALAAGTGAGLVDDAAQSLGARQHGEPVGGRGVAGVLSFGRGKPLSGLGGGAIAWSPDAPAPPEPTSGSPVPMRAMTRMVGYALARRPAVFRWLSAIPALGIGETVYDPHFAGGGIDGSALHLAAAAFPALDSANCERARRALGEAIARDTGFEPLLAEPDAHPAYPRLGVLAPQRASREAALEGLAHLGAARLYPDSLDRLEPLAPHRCSDAPQPGATRFAERLFTLPTHEQMGERQAREVVTRLLELS